MQVSVRSNLSLVTLANKYTSKLSPGFSLSSSATVPKLASQRWKQAIPWCAGPSRLFMVPGLPQVRSSVRFPAAIPGMC